MNKHEEYASNFRSWALNAFLNTSWVDNPTFDWFCKRINEALDETRNNVPFVVGVCGNAGCGKNAAVEFFTKVASHHFGSMRCTELAFADPIREISKIFGFTPEQMTDRVLKETVDEFWGISPRTFMQKVGTEMFRDNLDEDVWIKLALKRIEALSKPYEVEIGFPRGRMGTRRIIFITDVRFPNEAQAIRDIGGTIVKVIRDGFSKSGENLHPSEKFIHDMKCDLELVNKANSLEEWQWEFAKRLTIFFKHDAFFELNRISGAPLDEK
jgi:hypothetical protein